MENRTVWIDNAKGIAIICVVLGHFGINDVLTDIIYTFHMPLFFVISGFFLTKNVQSQSVNTFLLKKMKRLLVPYLFFSILLLLFYRSISFCPGFSKEYGNLDYISSFFNIFIELKRATFVRCHLWFLSSLFISNTIVWLVCRYFNFWSQVVIVMLLSSVAFVFNYFEPHTTIWFLDTSLVACIYVFLGTKFLAIQSKHKMPLYINVLLLLICILSSYINYKWYGEQGYVDMYNARYGNYILFIISSLLGSYLIIQLSKHKCFNVLSDLGRNSLLIYCLHFIPLCICLHFIEMYSFPTILTIIIKLLCCILILAIIVCVKPFFSNYLPWAIGENSQKNNTVG